MDRCIFYYYCYSTHHHLPSFPTRRSSDLLVHHHAQPDVIVTGLAEVFGEHLRERDLRPVVEHGDQVGEDEPLPLVERLVLAWGHHVGGGDALEHADLGEHLVGDHHVRVIAHQRTVPERGSGGPAGGHAEPPDQLAGHVLQPGLAAAGAVVVVHPEVQGGELGDRRVQHIVAHRRVVPLAHQGR